MRKAHFPKEGYIFQHKTETELFSRELYLAEGESLDDWREITEAEYEEQIANQMEMMSDDIN